MTLNRFHGAGLSWPLPEELTDVALEAKLFGAAGSKQGPEWGDIQRELKRKHVTLSLLWDEYIERNPNGYRLRHRQRHFCKRTTYSSSGTERKSTRRIQSTGRMHAGCEKLKTTPCRDLSRQQLRVRTQDRVPGCVP